ncbi:hypothetical protein MGH68_05490 [Erysipelothrix sp. D19-032]
MRRFDEKGVKHDAIDELFGVKGLRFEDIDGLRLRLVSDQTGGGFPPENQTNGVMYQTSSQLLDSELSKSRSVILIPKNNS